MILFTYHSFFDVVFLCVIFGPFWFFDRFTETFNKTKICAILTLKSVKQIQFVNGSYQKDSTADYMYY